MIDSQNELILINHVCRNPNGLSLKTRVYKTAHDNSKGKLHFFNNNNNNKLNCNYK